MTRHCLLQSIKTLLKLSTAKKVALPLKLWREPVAVGSNCLRLGIWKCPVFGLACPTHPSCAGTLPQELGDWFCSKNLRLSSGKAFCSDCRWLEDRWGLLPDQQVVKVLSAPKCLDKLCRVWLAKSFVGQLKMPKLRSTVLPSTRMLQAFSSSSQAMKSLFCSMQINSYMSRQSRNIKRGNPKNICSAACLCKLPPV